MADGKRAAGRSTVVVMLAASALLTLGCQPGPGMPLGLGPAGDNLLQILLLLAIGVGVYRLVAPRFRKSHGGDSPAAAESIARARYARGEITEVEYQQILRTLSTH